MAIDYSLEIINNQSKLEKLINQLSLVTVMALDIETLEWWNRRREQIALIQLAFHRSGQVKVAVIDVLAKIDLAPLQAVLERPEIIKVIHNAAFDAGKLAKFYKFEVFPVFDTMLAARRNGERKYSLQAQALTHLNLRLDKSFQKSDWSRRPLDLKQITYAALDAVAALLLYENQQERNLPGDYQSKAAGSSLLATLGFERLPEAIGSISQANSLAEQNNVSQSDSVLILSAEMTALLGIISELPTRYGPDQLAVSVATERVGLAGWIVDNLLGCGTDFDEESARLTIAGLFDKKLIKFTESRRLETTETGDILWKKLRNR